MRLLSEEELNHVANLARLELNDLEQEKFSLDLALILDDIEKIAQVDLSSTTNTLMICPTENKNEYKTFTNHDEIGKEEALKNSKLSDGDYIVVPQVIND